MKNTFAVIRDLPLPPPGFAWVVVWNGPESEILILPDDDTIFNGAWDRHLTDSELSVLAEHCEPFAAAMAQGAIDARKDRTSGAPQ
jgi:hypothetical protein